MDCAWVVGLRKDCKIALGLGRLGLLEGAGKAALLLSSMTQHDICWAQDAFLVLYTPAQRYSNCVRVSGLR